MKQLERQCSRTIQQSVPAVAKSPLSIFLFAICSWESAVSWRPTELVFATQTEHPTGEEAQRSTEELITGTEMTARWETTTTGIIETTNRQIAVEYAKQRKQYCHSLECFKIG
jgi:hypothetical protein